jgi:ABC-type cobalamin/Fe3+-siderophores transport system ATPase subunit
LAEADAMSGGQRLLVHVAHDLWAGTGAVRLRQVACALDSTHLERVVTALRFVHGDEAAASRAGFRVAA